jgi:hypothetical protein
LSPELCPRAYDDQSRQSANFESHVFSGMTIRSSSVAVGMVLVGLTCALVASCALFAPQTGFAEATGLAPVAERRADKLAAGALTDARRRDAAVRTTLRSLKAAPANPTAWLRLAYLDSLGETGVTSVGNRALAASYAMAPYGPDVTPWRLRFALNQWAGLSHANRRAVLHELMVTSRYEDHSDLTSSGVDEAGRLAVTLALLEHEAAFEQRKVVPDLP